MRVSFIVLLSLLVHSAFSQGTGTQKVEYHLPLSVQTCTSSSSCTTVQAQVSLDSNWRWTHNVGGYTNCYEGNTWDSTYCPDPTTCTNNCVLEGIDANDWSSPYGVYSSGSTLQLDFVTQGAYSKNIGSRTYLMSDDDNYYMFQLKNREFTFDVDVSNLPCGLNGALYFVAMDQDGGKARYPTNKGGAKYGEGYCDAQCPHDLKFINGEANLLDWQPSATDPNSGKGYYGTCCPEMDIWEANKYDTAYTAHPCTVIEQTRCEGVDCGDSSSGERYEGVCDKDGCDFNSYRMGDKTFFGPGSSFTLDSTQPMTVVTQFITKDGTDTGALSEIRRLYVQNGNVVQNSKTSLSGLPEYDSLTEANCKTQKTLFGETDSFTSKGAFENLDKAFQRGMVLVMSLWDDHEANMLWLDSNYPTDKAATVPGVARGSCATTSGVPSDVESQYPNSSVKFSNIKTGPIGSTYQKTVVTGFLEI